MWTERALAAISTAYYGFAHKRSMYRLEHIRRYIARRCFLHGIRA